MQEKSISAKARAFAERSLKTAVRLGASQYLILGAGRDTFVYREPCWAADLRIFELDRAEVLEEKRYRASLAGVVVPENVRYIGADITSAGWQELLSGNAAFKRDCISFCSMLGVVRSLTRESFTDILSALGSVLHKGSTVVFDYPIQSTSGELALAAYLYGDIERILENCGFLIYEHFDITDTLAAACCLAAKR